jgi:Glycine zipper 2TM domain
MKHLALLAAAGSLVAFTAPAQAAELPAAPAPMFASYNQTAFALGTVAAYDDDDDWRDRRDRRRYRDRDRDYEDRGRRLGRNDRVWRGNDGRYRCKRDDGTTGLVIGAIGGALAGRAVDTRGDRSLGTLLGAIGGGLLGREVDRGEARCR